MAEAGGAAGGDKAAGILSGFKLSVTLQLLPCLCGTNFLVLSFPGRGAPEGSGLCRAPRRWPGCALRP